MMTPGTARLPGAPTDVAAAIRHRLAAAWRRIGARRAAIALGLAAVAAGAALNWGWLTAIGVAPVLISLAPCAAMCAFGLCMPKMMGGTSCAAGQNGSNPADRTPGPPPGSTAAMQRSDSDPQ